MTVTNFAYTGANQSYTIPAGVYYIKATTSGAQGASDTANVASIGGRGATVVSVHKVTPAEVLTVVVGQKPNPYTSITPFGGGGMQSSNLGMAGGGGTDIRQGGTALSNRIVSAGGGGGCGVDDARAGTYKGGDAGAANASSWSGGGPNNTYGGYPATQSAGGAGGALRSGATENSGAGLAGTLGVGGSNRLGTSASGSGGGGGYYGGGGGSDWENGPGARIGYPGGGGSSRVISGILLSSTTGANAAAGSASIDTAYVPATPTITIPSPPTSSVRIGFVVDIKELHPVSNGTRTITYQLSKDSTFATGLITATVNFAAGTTSGAVSGDPSLGTMNSTQMGLWAALNAQGTWYLRVKTGGDNNLPDSLYTANSTVTSTHAPGASAVSPTGSAFVQYSATTNFKINVTDPWSGDKASSYQIVVEDNTTGTTILDTTKQPFAVPPALGQTTISLAIPSANKNALLRWKVRVWDTTDVASVYSDYSLFTLVDPPVTTITYPANNGTTDTGAPTFTWTVGLTSGRTVASTVISVREQATNNLLWQKTIAGAVYTATPDTTILVNAVNYTVTVAVTDNVGLIGSASNLFTTAYVSPDPIFYTVDASTINTLGYVELNWSNQAPDTRLVAWRVYRRKLPDNTWTLLQEIADSNVKLYRDYLVQSGTSYMWTVTQLADRSGSLLESPVGTRATGIGTPPPSQAEAQIELLDIDNYWIIDPDDPTLSMMIPQVTDASDTEEYDSADYNIVGRGRHRDYGDRLGYSGTLTSQVRIPERPSSVRLAAEALRAAQRTYYLRTPFGKLFPVALGSLGWTPRSGVGTVEMGELTIPYIEVA